MPLSRYGVLIGTLTRFAREDPNDFGSWYHGKLYIQAPLGEYECAVDVSTPSGIPSAAAIRAVISPAMRSLSVPRGTSASVPARNRSIGSVGAASSALPSTPLSDTSV